LDPIIPLDPISQIGTEIDQAPADLLTTGTLVSYLKSRSLLPSGAVVEVTQLDGGVSNVVLAADCGGQRLVVKQALPRLRVRELWLAKRERAISEAEALALAGRITPDTVPAVLDLDRDNCALTIAGAPTSWGTWKSRLLAGDVDPTVASRLGSILASWHTATFRDDSVARQFDDYEAFDQLRVDPFYTVVAERRLELADAIAALKARMDATHACLVHGDYSPKNVLVGDGLWVIDFEVAHYGDPAFDVAYMLNHLLLKLIHVRESATQLALSANSFWDAYRAAVVAEPRPQLAYVLAHVGLMMVARVDGKSPVEYLTAEERDAARMIGSGLLLDPPDTLDAAIEIVTAGIA
jgi:aminoglycoside phosphotransferase (APT) family kinase protein